MVTVDVLSSFEPLIATSGVFSISDKLAAWVAAKARIDDAPSVNDNKLGRYEGVDCKLNGHLHCSSSLTKAGLIKPWMDQNHSCLCDDHDNSSITTPMDLNHLREGSWCQRQLPLKCLMLLLQIKDASEMRRSSFVQEGVQRERKRIPPF
ncbi:hypothetical protein VNO77_27593 [Canavalia gladiata]|uniref:Uncharacterized protein n=1 Tax=Canavalia gladiata TaxID=3824 RepID=A0AAN9KV12_CANGL